MVKENQVRDSKSKTILQKKNFKKPFKKKAGTDGKKKTKSIVVSPLKQAYSNISRSLTNPELLKQRINEFLNLIQDNLLGNLGKLLGSKGLQYVVKYGTAAQRKRVMVLLMTLDIEKVLKGKYSYFFLKKLLNKARSDKVTKLFLDFFKNNFRKLFKSKHTFKFLDLYVTNVPHPKRLQIGRENLTANFFDEFNLKEFIDEVKTKPRLLELEISQLYLLCYFEKIPQSLVGQVLNIFLGQIDFMMKTDNLLVVLLLNRLFSAVDFKSKKEIMKKCLKDKFWDFYTGNKFFLGFLAHFMSEINDEKVLKVTLCKRSVERFVDFLSNVSLSKFLFLVFSGKPEAVFNKEKTLFAPNVKEALGVPSLESNAIFKKNCALVRRAILCSSEFASTMSFEFIELKTKQNHQYSILSGHMLDHLAQQEEGADKMQSLFKRLTSDLKGKGSLEESLLVSSSGHRLVKRIVQSMSQAHTSVLSSCEASFESFVEQCKVRFNDLVNSRAVFVIVSLVENQNFGEEMKEFVRQRKGVLQGMQQTGGIRLLLQVIE